MVSMYSLAPKHVKTPELPSWPECNGSYDWTPRMATFLNAILDFLKMQTQPNLMDGFNVFLGPRNIRLDTRSSILARIQRKLWLKH